MAALTDLARRRTDLGETDVARLHGLLADWQILADLSFADLVMWLPDRGGAGFWAGGQMRPTTGPTAYVDDVVGSFVAAGANPVLDDAWERGRLVRDADPEWRGEVPVRVEAVPVRHGDRVIAVVTREANLAGVRTPSRLELAYLQTAGDLTRMIADGTFPAPEAGSDLADSPRVGDGFVRVDEVGHVTYASPNALSVYRRLGLAGDLTGTSLAEVTRALVADRRRPDEELLSAVLGGRAHADVEIGTETVSLIVRSVALRLDDRHIGGLVLLRDVTELRRRDRALVSKDATIREIHHRVKNNLQTVAALLRLQARRVADVEAAEPLEEAVRRVGSIAIVHETLSQAATEDVCFDEVADRLARMVLDVGDAGGRVAVRRDGSFGVLASETATTLAMVLTELVQNAVEHGFGPEGAMGSVVLGVVRSDDRLAVEVVDDGAGLPPGLADGDGDSLGLSIVRTLVAGELGGMLALGPGERGGTRAAFDVRLPG